MRSSPIYSIINNPSRKADCSFGSSGFRQEIRVGTSASNSHLFGTLNVERYFNDDGLACFTLFLDGKLIRKGVLDGHTIITRDFEFTIDH